ncbi:uncharacterized protein LOC134251436, partial [Saccostrea cucullata]|uniref:uncharacterized protein LOC134251436 n=1 Tax=Saccostrea cuccullata TaxID=36930 RepID=UPI002ED5F322
MFSALKNHRIITLEEFRNQNIFSDIEYYCDQHSGKTVEVFCVDHTKLCFSVCFATKHRSCVDVKSLEDISETRNTKEDDILLEELREFIQDTIEMEKEFQKMKQNLKQESEETVEKTTQEVEKTKRLLAKKLDEFVCSHEKEAQEKINDLENIEKAVDGFKKTSKESFKILHVSAVMEGSSQKQRFLVSLQITQLSNQTLQKILELPPDVVAGYTYSTDEICQDVVRHFTFNGVKPTRKPLKGMQSLLYKIERSKSNEIPCKTDHQESEKMINSKECVNSGSKSEDKVEWICHNTEQNLNEKRDTETSQQREICEIKCKNTKSDNNDRNICSSSLGTDVTTETSEEITKFGTGSIPVTYSVEKQMLLCKNEVTYLNSDSNIYTGTCSRSYQANLRHSTEKRGDKTEANHYLEKDTKPYWERNAQFGMTGNYEVGISDNQNKNMVSFSRGYQASNASISEGQKGYIEESKREKGFQRHLSQNMGTPFRGHQIFYASNADGKRGYTEEDKTKEWFQQLSKQDTGTPRGTKFRNQDIFPEIEYYCDQHSSKTVEVFCVDHTKLCCSVCFATKHRSCVDVKSLEDISETRNPKEDDILLEKLRELIQDTNEMEKEFQKLKQNLKQESESTVEKVTQEVEKTKNLLAKKLDEFVCYHKKEAQEKMNDLENI